MGRIRNENVGWFLSNTCVLDAVESGPRAADLICGRFLCDFFTWTILESLSGTNDSSEALKSTLAVNYGIYALQMCPIKLRGWLANT